MVTNDKIIILLSELDRHLSGEVNTWAIKCLEQGFDSVSLRILASMYGNYSASELDNYLKRSLKELGWDNIDREAYLIRYAEIVAKQIIDNEKDSLKAAREIYDILLDLEYPSELMSWREVDEMIWDYNYFLKTGNKGHYFLEKEDLVKEINKLARELVDEK